MTLSATPQSVAIDIYQHLHVKPNEIGKYLAIKVGDTLTEGQLIAKKSSFLGVNSVHIQSPVNGIVTEINLDKGVIVVDLIGQPPSPEQLAAETETVELLPLSEQQPQLLTQPTQPDKPLLAVTQPTPTTELPLPAVQPPAASESKKRGEPNVVYGFGTGEGIGWFISGEFNEKMIVPDMNEKILLLKVIPTLSQMYKASAVGVEAVVVTGTDHNNQVSALENGLSGKAQIAFLLVAEGYNLSKLHGKHLQVDGAGKRLAVIA